VLFMILLVVGFIVGSFVLVLLLRDAPRVDMPDISPAAFIGSIYVAFVWFTGWANAPEVQTRFQALRAVRRSSRKRTGKEWMRIGPPPIFVKRWPMLQTLPLDVTTMERAFLVPYLGLLALAAAAIASVFLWVSRFAPGGQLIALIAFATAFLLVGAAFVGTRSAKRFARRPNGLLETAHTLGAVLWTGGSMPLTFAGALAAATMMNGGRATPADILMVGAWAAATVVMPAYAYLTARERLVTSKREFEGDSRVAFLALGSVVFAAMPVAYLMGRIMG